MEPSYSPRVGSDLPEQRLPSGSPHREKWNSSLKIFQRKKKPSISNALKLLKSIPIPYREGFFFVVFVCLFWVWVFFFFFLAENKP